VVKAQTSALTKGTHTLRLEITGNWVDIDWLQFTGANGETGQGGTTPILDTPALAGSAPYKLYNLQGTVVRQGYGNANLNGLPGGVYIVRTGSQTKTIVVR
jgi:hypothetical protein